MRFTQEISVFNPYAINDAVISLGTSIRQTANEIRIEATALYASKTELSSAFSQTATSFDFSLSENGERQVTLSMRYQRGDGQWIDVKSENITLDGLVTFNNLKNVNTSTVINGGNITTGSISLDRISGNSGTLTIQSDRLKINSGTIGLGNAIAANRWTIGGDSTRAWIYSGSKTDTKTSTAGIYIGTNGIEVKETTGSTGNVTRIDGDGILTTYINMYDSGANASTWMYFDDSNDYASGYHRMLFPRGIATGIYGEGAANNLFRNYTRCEGGLWVPDGAVDGSDRRLKKNITKIDRQTAMDFIKSLQPSSFKYKNGNDDFYHHGFIAQEAREKAWDGLVAEDEEDGMLGIRYHEIIADIVAVLQDLLAEREG